MTQTNTGRVHVRRRGRIGLGVLGLVVIFLAAGPPDLAPLYLFNGWSSDLDGGAHQLHLVLRGGGAVISVVLGLILILRPTLAIGVAQTVLATGIAYPVAGALGLFFWPPVAIYPIVGLVVIASVYFALRGQFPWQLPAGQRPVPSRALLVTTAIIAIPMLVFGLNEAALQRGPEVLHGELGHWAGATAMSVKFVLLGLLTSMKWPGWRVPAWAAAFTLFMFGTGSLLMPNQASSVGELWGAVAILASVAFVAVAELEGRLFPRTAIQPAA